MNRTSSVIAWILAIVAVCCLVVIAVTLIGQERRERKMRNALKEEMLNNFPIDAPLPLNEEPQEKPKRDEPPQWKPGELEETKDGYSVKFQVDVLCSGITLYKDVQGKYPEKLVELQDEIQSKGRSYSRSYFGRHGSLIDPWKHEYKYTTPGKHNPSSYDVWSVGPDGVDDTGDEIGNW